MNYNKISFVNNFLFSQCLYMGILMKRRIGLLKGLPNLMRLPPVCVRLRRRRLFP